MEVTLVNCNLVFQARQSWDSFVEVMLTIESVA